MTTTHPLQHYHVLGLPKTATQDEIKQAYRRLARTLHPDKPGGSAAAFQSLLLAFETLSDPKTRAVYDTHAAVTAAASHHTSRPYYYHAADPTTTNNNPAVPSGAMEAVLLQQMLARGAAHPCAVFDPRRQLCVTCEICRRPATQQCWTCKMDICEFCTRTQHWKGSVSLHWPLVNQPGSMLEQLGRRELELKRREDGQAYKEAQPDYRPQSEVQVLRQFQAAVVDIVKQQKQQQQHKSTTLLAAAPAMPVTSSTESNSFLPNGSSSSGGTPCIRLKQQQPPQQQQRSAFAMPRAGALATTTSTTTYNTSSINTTTQTNTTTSSSSSKALTCQQQGSTALAPLNHTTNSKPAPSNKCWQAWHQEASEEVRSSLLSAYDNRLARFYMWTQTDCAVLLAVHLATGGGKPAHRPALTINPSPTSILIQHEGFAPVLNRTWSNPIDAAAGVSSWTSADGQLLVVKVYKGQPGRMWPSCFKGDPHLARHLQSPYRLIQLPNEVQLELSVPFWVHPTEDIAVHIRARQLSVSVDGVMTFLRRTYYRDPEQAAKQGDGSYKVVDTANSSWCLLESGGRDAGNSSAASTLTATTTTSTTTTSSSTAPVINSCPVKRPSSSSSSLRRPDKVLSISLALPDPTDEELAYKKGVRQNNAAATRTCPNGAGKGGAAFFLEDEDEWGLQAVLQALLYHETGSTWLCPRPWELAAGAGSLISGSSSSIKSGGGSSSSGAKSTTGAPAAAAGAAVGVAVGSGYWGCEETALPPDVARHLKWLRAAAVSSSTDAAASAEQAEVAE